MAERRMFAKSIVLSDAFLDMPMSARCLYFTLGMLADDDGFVGNPKSIMRQCGSTDDDMKVLLAKRYVLGFDSGIIVIKHWRMNNYLRNDRYSETTYLEEKSMLTTDEKGSYTEKNRSGIPSGYQVVDKRYTQDSIGKDSKGKVIKHIYGEYKNVHLSDEEFEKLKKEFPSDYQKRIESVSEYCASTGKTYKNYLATIRTWARKETPKQEDSLPTYSTANNKKYTEDEEEELMKMIGGANYERWKKEHGK